MDGLMSPKSMCCALTPSATVCRDRAFKEVKLNKVLTKTKGTSESTRRKDPLRRPLSAAERPHPKPALPAHELGLPASRAVRK